MRPMFYRRPRPEPVKPMPEFDLWSKQEAIVESVRKHRMTAVPAGHGGG